MERCVTFIIITATIHSLFVISMSLQLPCLAQQSITSDGAISGDSRCSSQGSTGDLGPLVNLGKSVVVVFIDAPPQKISH